MRTMSRTKTASVLASVHQDAIWARTTAHHQLRSLLREFYPSFLTVFTSRGSDCSSGGLS